MAKTLSTIAAMCFWACGGTGQAAAIHAGTEMANSAVYPHSASSEKCTSDACKEVSPDSLASSYPDVVSVADLAAKAGNTNDYKEYGNKPSRWYQDMLGIMAIRPMDAEEIKSWFVPDEASAEETDNPRHHVKLSFNEGYQVDFFVGSYLSFRYPQSPSSSDLIVNSDHASFSGATYKEFQKNMDLFLELLRRKGLVENLLVVNPYYDLELKATARLQSASASVDVVDDFSHEKTCPSALCLWLLLDAVHGDATGVSRLRDVMPQFDWIALEALPASTQPAIDEFLSGDERDLTWQNARSCLINVIQASFGHYYPSLEGEANPYFQLLELARSLHKPVIALDVDMSYQAFRYGDALVGAATRSLHWALRLPETGSGVVFGGSAHFEPRFSANGTMQDFASDLHSGLSLFRLTAW